MNAATRKDKIRTNLWRMFAGAVVGATATGAFLAVVGDRYVDLGEPVTMLAVAVGLIYALMGMSVGFGLIAPTTGARFLNVEDADELREERPKLQIGAAVCILIGGFFLFLAFAESGTLIAREAALLIAGACLIGTVGLSLVSRKRTDEMTRQISLEASSFTLNTALLVLAVWAGLAQLGYVGGLNPLALVSALALLQLVAIMAAAAAKGLLMR